MYNFSNDLCCSVFRWWFWRGWVQSVLPEVKFLKNHSKRFQVAKTIGSQDTAFDNPRRWSTAASRCSLLPRCFKRICRWRWKQWGKRRRKAPMRYKRWVEGHVRMGGLGQTSRQSCQWEGLQMIYLYVIMTILQKIESWLFQKWITFFSITSSQSFRTHWLSYFPLMSVSVAICISGGKTGRRWSYCRRRWGLDGIWSSSGWCFHWLVFPIPIRKD